MAKTKQFSSSVDNILKTWIILLGLSEWDISWHIASEKSDISEDSLAEVQVESSVKWAHIVIAPLSKFEAEVDRSLQQVLVHELLHIKFALIQPDDLDTTEYRVQHQLIDELATTFDLIKQKRI
jgi:hypothetical protein